MKLLILFFLSLMVSLCSFLGEARADILRAYLLNPEIRYERNSAQELENRSPRNFSVGYQYTRWSALLEYAHYSETSGNATSSFERTHEELVAWFRYHGFAWTFAEGYNTLQLYGAVGAGAFQESLTTKFMTDSRKDTGRATFMSGLAIGGEFSRKVNQNILLVGAIEGRALMASDFDPNPMWSAVLRFGVGVFLN